MIALEEIINFLDEELSIATIPDYSAALNGLQLENDGRVRKIAVAVDASYPVIQKAIEAQAQLLVVHHGMFWQGAERIVKNHYKKLKTAMDANLALYSAHIPLDIHPVLGNNACLAREIELKGVAHYHPWKGIDLGLSGTVDCSYEELLDRVRRAVGGEIHHCPGKRSHRPGKIGVLTGGAGSEIQSMHSQGIETFITGEGPHWSYGLAEELGVNLIYAGHYATETFGVRQIGSFLRNKYQLEMEFVDHPTGL